MLEADGTLSKTFLRFKDCEECGAEFAYQYRSRRFCAKKCSDAAKYRKTFVSKKPISGLDMVCAREGCENIVHVYPRQIKNSKQRFCSRRCNNEALKTNDILICVICTKEFYCSKSQQRLRNRKTCSMECRSRLMASKKVGSVKLRRGLMHTAQGLCNKYARLRDTQGKGGVGCISCGVWYPYDKLDGGHFISSTSSSVRFDLRNINAQCWKCNRYLSGNGRHYLRGMIKKYGEDVTAYLESQEFVTKKWSVEALEELIADIKLRTKQLEKSLV